MDAKKLLEIADDLFDGLHAIVYQVPTKRDAAWAEKAYQTAVKRLREVIAKGFDPTEGKHG